MAEKQYVVKSLSVGGKGSKIYRCGDLVTASCFSAKAEDLVKQGFLEEIPVAEAAAKVAEAKVEVKVSEPEEKKDAAPEEKPEAANESTSTTLSVTANAADALPAFENITKKQIQKRLTEKGIVFDEKATKTALYELLKK